MKPILIVGLGIASINILKSIEAKKGIDYLVVDDGMNKTSKVASGLINPIFIKYYKKAWKADLFHDKVLTVYTSFNKKYGEVFNTKNILKLIKNNTQYRSWSKYSKRLHPYVDGMIFQRYQDIFKRSNDFGEIKKIGLLNFGKLEKDIRKELISKGKILERTFDYNKLKSQGNGEWLYDDKLFSNVIFCEGLGVSKNLFFKDLPIYKNKGEIIQIYSKELKLKDIVSSSVFIIPEEEGENIYKVGATYNRKDQYEGITKEARVLLKEKLSSIISCNYEVIGQSWGFRPSVMDRKPIIGEHQLHKGLYIMNGLGSRGMLMAPLLSEHLIDNIVSNKELWEESNVNRFF